MPSFEMPKSTVTTKKSEYADSLGQVIPVTHTSKWSTQVEIGLLGVMLKYLKRSPGTMDSTNTGKKKKKKKIFDT